MATFTVSFGETNSKMGARFGETYKVSTTDYEDLYNKPRINGVELRGNKLGAELNLQDIMQPLTEADIDEIMFGGD